MIRRWTVRKYSSSKRPTEGFRFVAKPSDQRFLTRYGAQREAHRLNALITDRTPYDPLYRPVAQYRSSRWRRIRIRLTQLRKANS